MQALPLPSNSKSVCVHTHMLAHIPHTSHAHMHAHTSARMVSLLVNRGSCSVSLSLPLTDACLSGWPSPRLNSSWMVA